MATVPEILSASQGTFMVNDGREKTINFDVIVVLSNTVFTSIKVGGVDIKDTLIADPTIALKTGAIIRVNEGQFSGIQLTSGQVALVL
jgi:hypothetical protein